MRLDTELIKTPQRPPSTGKWQRKRDTAPPWNRCSRHNTARPNWNGRPPQQGQGGGKAQTMAGQPGYARQQRGHQRTRSGNRVSG